MPSLGPDTPRNFDPGYYQQVDMNLSADFTYSMSDSTELAFGMEYRTEEFTVGAGQEESYTAGVLGTQGFSTSSNGFPSFPAKTAGTFERSNLAAYVQSGWQASDALYVESALRFEDFEDFGVTTNYKLGFNYDLDGDLFLRGTYSTGFKAQRQDSLAPQTLLQDRSSNRSAKKQWYYPCDQCCCSA